MFRTKDGLGCLRDMCPHRAASFSGGAVVDDTVQCPYHGWQFDRHGQCAHIPMLEGERPNDGLVTERAWCALKVGRSWYELRQCIELLREIGWVTLTVEQMCSTLKALLHHRPAYGRRTLVSRMVVLLTIRSLGDGRA